MSFYALIGLDQTEAEVDACMSEISDYLIPHSNWGSILPPLSGCPEIEFAQPQWNHTGNEWVCFAVNSDADDVQSVHSARVTGLAYDLTMRGVYNTEGGEDLEDECVFAYTQDLLAVTSNQVNDVNALLGDSLCNGLDISIATPSARIAASGSVVSVCGSYVILLE